ncbi:hypothetical protein GBAR_LOCUS24226, partial [Geodia barretti]
WGCGWYAQVVKLLACLSVLWLTCVVVFVSPLVSLSTRRFVKIWLLLRHLGSHLLPLNWIKILTESFICWKCYKREMTHLSRRSRWNSSLTYSSLLSSTQSRMCMSMCTRRWMYRGVQKSWPSPQQRQLLQHSLPVKVRDIPELSTLRRLRRGLASMSWEELSRSAQSTYPGSLPAAMPTDMED